MNNPYAALYSHMFMSEPSSEPTDSQLDYFDEEYHRIIKKQSNLSANERRRVTRIWNKYRKRLGYSEEYTQELREKYKRQGTASEV